MKTRYPQPPDGTRRAIWRQVATATLLGVAASVLITTAITWLVSGSPDPGLGAAIAVLVPALLVPVGSYWHISLAARLGEANRQLRELSETDPLTRACNRRRFLEVAFQQLALARRHGYPTSLLLVDFDHFKDINDRFGHATGDEVLVEATRRMQGALRDTDTLARFGGEEFIVLLPHTAREGALLVAERILAAIREPRFAGGAAAGALPLRVTASIGGVACETSATSLEAMTSHADRLLYAAKQGGRDRCRVAAVPGQGALPLQVAGGA